MSEKQPKAQTVRVITKWCDWEAKWRYHLQHLRPSFRFMIFFVEPAAWVDSAPPTYSLEKAQRWATHYNVEIETES